MEMVDLLKKGASVEEVSSTYSFVLSAFPDLQTRARPLPKDLISKLFQLAKQQEAEAIRHLEPSKDAEPTRSLLCRSAAAIAYEAEDYKGAIQFAAMGLSGFPPKAIESELFRILDDSSFSRHMGRSEGELKANQFELTLAGPMVGHGSIPITEFNSRVQVLQQLLIRTAERQIEKEYRQIGPPMRKLFKENQLVMRVPHAASFGTVLTLRGPREDRQLPLTASAPLAEMKECLKLFEDELHEDLRARMKDNEYFLDFVMRARELSPDGKRITGVGLQFSAQLNNDTLVLKKTKSEWRLERPVSVKPCLEELTGFLTLAELVGAGKAKATLQDIEENRKVKLSMSQAQLLRVKEFFGERQMRVLAEAPRGRRGTYRVLEIEALSELRE